MDIQHRPRKTVPGRRGGRDEGREEGGRDERRMSGMNIKEGYQGRVSRKEGYQARKGIKEGNMYIGVYYLYIYIYIYYTYI